MKKILSVSITIFCFIVLKGQNHISPNYYSCAYLNNNGEVYMAGRNTELSYSNYLGTGSTANYISTASKVNFPTNVKIQEVSSSFASFQLALSCEGNVYAWGINEAGEIGIDWQISSFSPTPLKVPAGETGSNNEFLSNVKAVRAGLVQSFALLENGKAVAWGKNIDGGLGIGNNTSVSTPKYVRKTVDSILENIIQLETGEGITLALVDPDNDGLGTVYIWGKNSEYSNLISRTTDLNFARPLVDANGKEINNIRQIAIGSSNALLLDKDYYVWTWGNSTFSGQEIAGTGNLKFPSKVFGGAIQEKYLKAKAIACGSAFSMAITMQNSVVAWGLQDNQAGNLGNNSTTIAFAPAYSITSDLKPLQNIIKIYAGGGSGFAINAENQIYCWGANTYGELSYGNTLNVKLAKLNPIVTNFALADIAPHDFIISQNKEKLCVRESVDLTLNEPYLKNSNYTVNWNFIDLIDLSPLKKDTISVENPGKYNAIISYTGTNKICSASYPTSKSSLNLDSYIRGFTVNTPTSYCGNTAEIEILNNNEVLWYEDKNQAPYQTTTDSESLMYPVSRQLTSDFNLYVTEKPSQGILNLFSSVPSFDLNSTKYFSSDNFASGIKIIVYNDVEINSLSFIYQKGFQAGKTFTSKVIAYSNTNLQVCGAPSSTTPIVANSSTFSFPELAIDFSVQNDPKFVVQKVDFSLFLKGSPEGIVYWLTIADLQKLGQSTLYSPIVNTKSFWEFNSNDYKIAELKSQVNYCNIDTNNSFFYNIEMTAANKCQPMMVQVYKDCPTGLEKTDSNAGFSIYPNPANNFVNISGTKENDKIELYSSTGLFIKELNATDNNLDFLNSGTYLIKVSGDDGLTSKLFIKN